MHADGGNQANVMLSYPIDEAGELLVGKLGTAKTSLSNCEEDLDFLREQITVRPPPSPAAYEIHKLTGRRRWRSRSRGYITGTWCRSGRIRRRVAGRSRRKRRGLEGPI